MSKTLIEHWSKNEIPGIDCIVKSNGDVIILNSYQVSDGNGKKYFSFPLCDTTVDSLEKYNDDIWAEFQVFSNRVSDKEGNNYFGGEGGLGNEGFLACTDSSNGLKWVLFCERSNPFIKVDLMAEYLLAYTNSELFYKIKLDSPEKIIIQKLDAI